MKTRRNRKPRYWREFPCIFCGGEVGNLYWATCDPCRGVKRSALPPWAWKLAAVLAGVYFVALAIVWGLA